jgi:hypothetical protein
VELRARSAQAIFRYIAELEILNRTNYRRATGHVCLFCQPRALSWSFYDPPRRYWHRLRDSKLLKRRVRRLRYRLGMEIKLDPDNVEDDPFSNFVLHLR